MTFYMASSAPRLTKTFSVASSTFRLMFLIELLLLSVAVLQYPHCCIRFQFCLQSIFKSFLSGPCITTEVHSYCSYKHINWCFTRLCPITYSHFLFIDYCHIKSFPFPTLANDSTLHLSASFTDNKLQELTTL